MTVATTTAISGPYAPDGVATSFPFDFGALSAADVQAVRVSSTGAETVLTGYTVTISPTGGGSVAFLSPPVAGDPIYLKLDPSFEQQDSFANQGNWSPETLDGALDRSAMRDIYLEGLLSRTALAPLGETMGPLPAKAVRAGLFAGWDAGGNPIALNPGGADSALRTDLAAATGSSLVNWIRSATGAVARTISGIFNDRISVKDFGAKGDNATDDTASIQAGLNYVHSIGGGTLYFPEGSYKVSAYLTVYPHTILRGAGRRASVITGTHAGGGGANAAENARNGSIFYNASPIDTTGDAYISIHDLWVTNTNAANQGAAFYQQSGTTITIRDCLLSSKYGVILDQSEDVLIIGTELGSLVAGGAGLWMVNGPGLMPGALTQFTAAITLIENHYNVGSGSHGIIDDGGMHHTIIGGDFNGGIVGYLTAGATPATIIDPYMEGQSDSCISMSGTTSAGLNTVGGSIVALLGGFFSASSHPAIRCNTSAGSLSLNGGFYAGSVSSINGAGNLFQTVLIGYSNLTGQPFTDVTTTQGGPFIDLVRGLFSGVSSTGPVGYAIGAGGAVTQLTSKSTGVTLNKVTGAITLNNAALAAGAVVSFTLTNSTIAADDELTVRLKSGFATPATYRAWAEGNAAGSRTIILQNISGGSLSEAVVLGFVLIKGASA